MGGSDNGERCSVTEDVWAYILFNDACVVTNKLYRLLLVLSKDADCSLSNGF